jgi:hypothetical protein
MYFVVFMNACAEITIRDAKVHFYYGRAERKIPNLKLQIPNLPWWV